ncbi:phosphate/phosphite/phosphonate ABC transporter substrate-binding protein [Wenzhouxiangella sp. EGI_FJ10409]|uniref:phosphate/phosphite/phosphonate ABC transporter substrate-binding protein n=1 Tax=Wenzhouxiangella sp. EGI_FJ10409 TaxID=3243767 RepID=UPI0035D56A1D
MKTSIRLPALVLGLILAASAWAQEEEQQATETSTPEEVEIFAESAAEDAEPADTEAASDGEAQAEVSEQAEATEEEAPAATDESTPESAEAGSDGAEIFTFQAHPIFPPRTAELVYRPLVDYLNDALPYRFELKLAPDYHRYWLSTRRGENPHLVLEEPHLTAYRMNQYDFTPLVRAVEPITYSLLTSMNNTESSVQDFIGRRVSTMPAPSLGYLVLASWFDNPMQQPLIQSNAASWLDAVEIVFSQEADAAIVPHNLVSRYVNMANVLTSQEFPGVTIAASAEVPIDIQEEIRAALLRLHEDDEHFAALNELDIDQFVEARPSQYEDLDEWLSLVYSIL